MGSSKGCQRLQHSALFKRSEAVASSHRILEFAAPASILLRNRPFPNDRTGAEIILLQKAAVTTCIKCNFSSASDPASTQNDAVKIMQFLRKRSKIPCKVESHEMRRNIFNAAPRSSPRRLTASRVLCSLAWLREFCMLGVCSEHTQVLSPLISHTNSVYAKPTVCVYVALPPARWLDVCLYISHFEPGGAIKARDFQFNYA
jgi:hypothetical protein